jgi:hypothetical protein
MPINLEKLLQLPDYVPSTYDRVLLEIASQDGDWLLERSDFEQARPDLLALLPQASCSTTGSRSAMVTTCMDWARAYLVETSIAHVLGDHPDRSFIEAQLLSSAQESSLTGIYDVLNLIKHYDAGNTSVTDHDIIQATYRTLIVLNNATFTNQKGRLIHGKPITPHFDQDMMAISEQIVLGRVTFRIDPRLHNSIDGTVASFGYEPEGNILGRIDIKEVHADDSSLIHEVIHASQYFFGRHRGTLLEREKWAHLTQTIYESYRDGLATVVAQAEQDKVTTDAVRNSAQQQTTLTQNLDDLERDHGHNPWLHNLYQLGAHVIYQANLNPQTLHSYVKVKWAEALIKGNTDLAAQYERQFEEVYVMGRGMGYMLSHFKGINRMLINSEEGTVNFQRWIDVGTAVREANLGTMHGLDNSVRVIVMRACREATDNNNLAGAKQIIDTELIAAFQPGGPLATALAQAN